MLTLSTIFALISGSAVINTLLYVIVLGVIFWLLYWLISYLSPPQPFNKIARVILAIAAVIVIINVLLGLVGHPIIRW